MANTTTQLRDAPALAAAGLGLLSGIASVTIGSASEPDWLKPIGKLFLLDTGGVAIGAYCGVAIGVAVAMASTLAGTN